jgi:uncharacterized membrane protein
MKWTELRNPDAGPVSRVDAVDLFRFIVLFFMIQGHLFRAYLLPSIRLLPWYKVHELFHGFVAPGFLFAAGFAAFLSFHNKRQNYIRLGGAFFKRLRRILFVIAIGYWIHLPFFSLGKTLQAVRMETPAAADFLSVNILQCIGIGLLLFTLLAVLLKGEKRVVLVTGLAGAAFFLLAGPLQGVHLHPALDPFLNYNPIFASSAKASFFPVFPWLGYLCIGIVAAFLYTQLQREVFFRLLLAMGVVFFPWFFFQSSQSYFKAELTLSGNLNKAGGIFLLLGFSEWLLRRCGGGFLDLLKRAGSESLFVYVLHLFVIFNSFFRRGLMPLFENRLDVLQATLLFLAVQLAVFALSLLYNHVKERRPLLWRWGFNLFWLAFLLAFAFRPH